ncbi:hypothetical protein ANO14919_099070 [Xylariales sp. No.14919]|nr:hypothetical protein ANO14919_099070 [Xylariales sp. No.14919]
MQSLSQSLDKNTKNDDHRRRRPARLRNACNACCTAKVKCSGERTGCARCRANGGSCLYVESRAGKVPGIRAKRKQSQTQAPGPGQVAITPCSETSPLAKGNAQVADIDFSGVTSTTDLLSWSGWSFEGGVSIDEALPPDDSVVVGPNSRDNDSSTTHDSPSVPSRAGSHGMPMGHHASLGDSELNFATPDTSILDQNLDVSKVLKPLSLGTRPRDEEDSQCFLECCHLLRDLEDIIKGELRISKVALWYIKQALDQGSKLIEQQQESKNLRCRMLLDTLMYQVVELFEMCLSASVVDKDRLRKRATATSGLLLSGVGLGDYGMEAQEQLAISTQAAQREILHANGVLDKLKEMAIFTGKAACDLPHGLNRVGRGGAGGDYHADLQFRLDDLATRIAAI